LLIPLKESVLQWQKDDRRESLSYGSAYHATRARFATSSTESE
jgi:hypothetical protein